MTFETNHDGFFLQLQGHDQLAFSKPDQTFKMCPGVYDFIHNGNLLLAVVVTIFLHKAATLNEKTDLPLFNSVGTFL